jgi:hypothetical protein
MFVFAFSQKLLVKIYENYISLNSLRKVKEFHQHVNLKIVWWHMILTDFRENICFRQDFRENICVCRNFHEIFFPVTFCKIRLITFSSLKNFVVFAKNLAKKKELSDLREIFAKIKRQNIRNFVFSRNKKSLFLFNPSS